MPIVASGSINTTALVVPGLYIQIVPPQNLVLNGVPTNVIGVVGTATWGPTNQALTIGSMADYARSFGAVQNRKYDMGTAVAIAVQQGAQAFRCVRVTDGTDAAATATIQTNGLTVTALYSGTSGNNIVFTISAGSKASTWRAVVGMPGLTPEVYDNISGTGNAFWVNLANAINTGTSDVRGPSLLITATAGASTTAPVAGSTTLTGGTDGATTITAATLVGSDTLPRKGMYALRTQGCSIGVLADADDSTQYTTIDAFGMSEGMYMIQVLPAGTSITNAVTTKQTAGLDDWSSKLMHGDWIYWRDQVNNLIRLVSPQGFIAGRLANLSPEQSSLNKQIYSIVGSQKSGGANSGTLTGYVSGDLQTLFQSGIDVIGNPSPGGYYWSALLGHNSSSNASVNGDNYSRLTNYIAATLNSGMGKFVGQTINAALFRNIRATLLSYLQNLLNQGILGSTTNTTPFSVVCDASNNPQSRTALGYVQADVQVQYMGINEKFIVNLEGGTTVQVSTQTLPGGQPATGVAA